MIEALSSFVEYAPQWLPRLGRALLNTAIIAGFGFLLACVLGMVLALCLMRSSIWLRRCAGLYISFFRGVPLLVVLFLIYFALPEAGLLLSALHAAILGLGLCFAAQMAEVIRAGFLAIPKGQQEAAAAVGMTPFQTFRDILLPQVLKVIAPSIIVTFVALLKDSSLASLITVKELMLEGRALSTEYFMPLQIFIWVGLFYFCLAFPLSLIARRLARKT